ncbi:hypothetical protein FRC02_011376 [Tulasnella sp. 418]|nr:hypothetical protein FRC02_011376 [Tulasnella sp. 418]
MVRLNRTLVLDSTSFLSGNLLDDTQASPRFSLSTQINSNGPMTTISSLATPTLTIPSEVGVVEWRSSAIGRRATVVKFLGQILTLGSLMKVASFGSLRHFALGGLDCKWKETDGTWQCTAVSDSAHVLAVLHSRIATRGTRIEISDAGHSHMDKIVLTALLVLHGENDWKAFQRRENSPYSFYQPRMITYTPAPHVAALTLTLSSTSFLDGLLAVGGQIMYCMRTHGNRTSVLKYTWDESPRLEEFASIEWLSSGILGKYRSQVTFRGQRECLDDFMFSSFLGNRMRRFGLPGFLPWLQWMEDPPAWQCVSHPGRRPLALLDRRFLTAGTNLEVTMEGLEYIDALVLTVILVVQGPADWRALQAQAAVRNAGSARPTTGGRTMSANQVVRPRTAPSAQNGPPGLPRSASETRISRLSGISGESEMIPAYSPAPRGLALNHEDTWYRNQSHGGTPAISTAVSRANSPPPGEGPRSGAANNLLPSNRASVSLPWLGRSVHPDHDEPPSYGPPSYES